jgi:hypothetical protein
MLLIYEIELPKDEDVSAFRAFMRDEYIPAVHKGPTRVGQVKGLELLERDASETGHRFLWLVRWDGLNPQASDYLDDEAVRRKFEAFGATMKDHVAWQEVAGWVQPAS